MDYVAGADVPLTVPFRRNGEPFVPDVGSVKWTLRDAAGAAVVAYTDVAVTTTTTTTSINLTVPAAQNGLTGRFEKRTVVISGTRNSGTPFSFNVPYRIHPWLNHTVTPDDVRNFIGVGTDELPDDTIDILSAYIQLESSATQAVLDAAFIAGGVSELKANKALVGRCVLDALPALRQRLLVLKADGPLRAQRDKLDLDKIEELARAAITEVAGGTGGTFDATDSFFQVVIRTDPFTGA